MFKKNKNKIVEENQYRAVIEYGAFSKLWTASIERRTDIDKWKLLYVVSSGTQKSIEEKAKKAIAAQKNLDKDRLNPIQYIIYDD